jgi:hypothetical protein
MGTVVLADVTELTTVKISELDETLSTGNDDDVPIVKEGKTQRVKKPNLVHTQNTDTILDEGGANEVAVTELVRKATANITYYVATDGSDSNPGTDAEPFATIQHAVDLLPKELNGYNVYIYIKNGTYEESVRFKGFSGGYLSVFSDAWDADAVKIEAPVDKSAVFSASDVSAYLSFGAFSLKIQRNGGSCIWCRNCTYLDILDSKLGDNDNTGTAGIISLGSTISVETVTDIDANKVATGIRSMYSALVTLYNTTSFGDTFVDVSSGGIVTNGIHLVKADYDDAITKKHTQNTDTALGAQSENLDMNTHKIINVVDPIDDQDAITKLFASNMAINGGAF